MTTPYDPMRDFQAAVLAAAPELTGITVGAALGTEQPPFATIRRQGGLEPDAQVPYSQRRVDVNVYHDRQRASDAAAIAEKIYQYLRFGTGTLVV